MQADRELSRAALLLSLIQFFFFTTWIVYVVYLGDLLEAVGIGRDMLIWFILLDQAVFTFADTAMGYNADRFERLMGRLGPWIITVNGISCLAFLALPFSAGLGGAAPLVFILLAVIWIATSSVLRAPPLVLLMKHAARPKAPRLAALSLLGLALGGAVSPYLGQALKALDPAVPFVVTSLTLFATTLGLVWVQRVVARLPAEARDAASQRPAPRGMVSLLMLGSLFIAFGFQVHYFLNSKAQYLAFIDEAELVLYLPLFWIGFKLLVFPGAAAARRLGAIGVMGAAATAGGVGLIVAAYAESLALLVVAQMLAGGAWGVVFMAGISAALGLGSSGREGLILGLWFTVLSFATLVRAGLVAGGIKGVEDWMAAMDWVPALMWALGASVLLVLALLERARVRRETENGGV